jgi:hypothetical protein
MALNGGNAMRKLMLSLSLAALAGIGLFATSQARASDLRVYVDLGDIAFDYGRPYYRHGHVPLYVEHVRYGPPRYYYHRSVRHHHYPPPGHYVRHYAPPPRYYKKSHWKHQRRHHRDGHGYYDRHDRYDDRGHRRHRDRYDD